MKQLSKEIVNARLSNSSIKLIGEFTLTKDKTLFIDNSCGHTWLATPTKILIGRGCPRCAHKEPLFGVGINDANYDIFTTDPINNTRIMCKYYMHWSNMIERCFSKKLKEKYPTYKDVTCIEQWKYFSNFRVWMETQDWLNKELDKDILVSHNKTYSPETSMFIPRSVNALLHQRENKNGMPIGVSKTNTGYASACTIKNKQTYLGRFDSVKEAAESFLTAKSLEVERVALLQQDIKLQKSLLRISQEILAGTYYL